MNSERAKDIVSTPNMVNVTYENSPVYMEIVNDSDQTCTIHYMNQPNTKMNVPLSSLIEH